MKRFLFLLAAAVLALGASKNPRLAYIEKYSALAVSEMQRTGVPASITLAQGLVESGAGLSPLAQIANNHFGLKCHNDWEGEKYYKDDEQVQECFRAYESAEESFRAHSDFLRERERYQSLFDLDPTDYKGWAKGLRRAGYATDPAYATKLITLIEDFQLYRFDQEAPVEVPSPREEQLGMLAAVEGAAASHGSTALLAAAGESGLVSSAPAPHYSESATFSLSRPVYEENGVAYVRAVEGETYSSIADAYGLFARQVLRFNDVDSDRLLQPGSRVYLDRKKAQCAQAGKYLVERDGETLWEISQMFGIQLSKLRLYNIFHEGTAYAAGETVILRKL
ncbi:MAG: glucosaminidase domain-containing protein [Bacteroidales bacterium]|nr:glucosaminidase domain-containing protein [Bacteroidales bacterium]